MTIQELIEELSRLPEFMKRYDASVYIHGIDEYVDITGIITNCYGVQRATIRLDTNEYL